jgi:hypothetical protein
MVAPHPLQLAPARTLWNDVVPQPLCATNQQRTVLVHVTVAWVLQGKALVTMHTVVANPRQQWHAPSPAVEYHGADHVHGDSASQA